MKQMIPNYTFTAAAKTIALTDFGTIRLDRLLLVVNVTRGVIYFNFADSAKRATVATNVITLTDASTSGHADADKLEIIYDTVSGDPDYLTGQPVVGNVASAATDSGNPVKVGGVYNSTQPTLTTGQRGDMQLNLNGDVIVAASGLVAGDAVTLASVAGFTSPTSATPRTLGVSPYVYNGSTWDRMRSDGTTGGQGVGGTVASGATDSGNPVKVGAKYNSTQPTFTDGQRGDMQLDTRGNLKVTFIGKDGVGGVLVTSSPGDALTGVANWLGTAAIGYVYNGTTWDRHRSDGTTGGAAVGGSVASAATDSGNPVKVGGKYNSTLPTFTDGQRGDIQITSQGVLMVSPRGASQSMIASNVGDATNGSNLGTLAGYVFNGSTWDRARSDGTTGGQGVGGTVASAATDSGNPVKVGAKYNSTLPTFTDGQRGDLQIGTRGSLNVTIRGADNTNAVDTRVSGDAIAGQIGLTTNTQVVLYNGSTWDRQRGTSANVVLASGARTTTQTQADQTNYNHKGIKVVVDVTSAGTGSITASIQGKDANGIYYTILTGAAIVTNSTNVYTIYPGLTAATNVTANDVLPRTYRVVITANNANTITYSVSAELIL